MKFQVIDHEGYLCIATEWMRSDMKPVDFRRIYETGLKVVDGMDDYGYLIGSICLDNYNGDFMVCSDLTIRTNGKQIHEEKPIKRPKWAKGYSWGEWRRYEVEEVA